MASDSSIPGRGRREPIPNPLRRGGTSREPSVILASAGSGKTHELAGRYVRALVENAAGGAADRILATTFTRKAAAEMFAKVLVRLLAAADESSDRGRAELRESVGREVSAREARELVIGLVRRMDRVRVQTLDSFFAEVGRAFAPELGLTPGWRILDDVEIAEAKEKAIDRVCERLDATALMVILEGLNGGALPMLPRRELLSRAEDLHGAYMECGGTAEKWGAIVSGGEGMLSDEDVRAARRGLLELPPVMTGSGTPNKHFANSRAAIEDCFAREDWKAVLGIGLVCAVRAGKADYSRARIPPEIAEVVSRLTTHAAAKAVHELAAMSGSAGALARAFDGAYAGVKEEQNSLTFEDLPRKMLTLPREKSDWLSFRMDSGMDSILLDEFQDTSRVQYLVLEPLLREIVGQESPGRSVFAVGDVKQSIYGWRGAEPELLAGLSERLGLGVPGTMARSWRSSRAVLDVVNAVFEGIERNTAMADFADVAARWKRNFETHTAAKDLDGSVRLLQARAAGDGESAEDVVIDEAVERVIVITKERPEWRVGVLTRTNGPIPRLIHRLRKRGIFAAQEKGHPLTDEPCVNAILSVLQLAEHPGDSASQYHVGKSAFAGALQMSSPLGEELGERVSRELRERIAQDGIAGLVSWLRGKVEDRLSERGRDRIGRVERLAAVFDARAGGRIPEFIRLVEDSAVNDPSEGFVSVMTVHRAKGLEWDAVVMMDLERKWRGQPPRVVVDRGMKGEEDPLAPVEAVTLWPGEELQACDARLMAIADRSRARQVREELSGLYVALTRARVRLEMIVANVEDSQSSLTSAAVLRAALAPGRASPEPGEIKRWEWKAEQGAILSERPREKQAWATRPVTLRFVPAPEGGGRGRAPSKRKTVQAIADILRGSGGNLAARRIGHVWHAWMESVEWADDWKADDAILLESARRFGCEGEEAREQLAAFRAALTGPIGAALSRKRYEGRGGTVNVAREWALAWSDEGLVSGRVDRVVIGIEGGRPAWAEVLDFKTDRVDSTGVGAAAEGYRAQMEAYRQAIGRALRVQDVGVALVFTSPGVVVDMG